MSRTTEAKRLIRELREAKARHTSGETSFDVWFGERRMIIREAEYLNLIHEILDVIHGPHPCQDCSSIQDVCGEKDEWLCPDCYGDRKEGD